MAAAWESLRPEEDPGISPQARARFLGAGTSIGGSLATRFLRNCHALRQALIDHPDLEGVDYDLLIVDEYQDLNASDLAALHLLAETGCSMVGAGDDDQSIYSFRRAAPEELGGFTTTTRAPTTSLCLSASDAEQTPSSGRHSLSRGTRRPPWPRLQASEGAPPGEVGLLAFDGQVAEARGIATLIQRLIEEEGVPSNEILVLLRSDFNEHFSRLVERELDSLEIAYSDPEAVDQLLAERENRWLLAAFRLLVNHEDSMAWASLLALTAGIGESFMTHVYESARTSRTQFGAALLAAHASGFDGAPAAPAGRAAILIDSVAAWLDEIEVPDMETDWGNWIVETSGGPIVGAPSEDLRDLLLALDETAEPRQDLGQYLGQVAPLGKDRALAESNGVRIMTMGGAKGLTVQATIVAALEDQVIPRVEPPLDEERRLLYVALTRARKYVFGYPGSKTHRAHRSCGRRTGGHATKLDAVPGGWTSSISGRADVHSKPLVEACGRCALKPSSRNAAPPPLAS